MIGDKVFFVNFKDKKIIDGVMTGESISSSGYCLIEISFDGGTTHIESPLTFQTKEAAEAKLAECFPIVDEIDKIRNDLTDKMNKLREQIIGLPQFKHLLKKEQPCKK